MNLLSLPAMSPGGGQLSDIFLPLLMLLFAVIIGAVMIHVLRSILRRSEERPGEGFTLHDLRTMYRTGALSDEEFHRAKATLLEQVGRAVEDAHEGPETPQNEQPD
jgi:hypothetical protein